MVGRGGFFWLCFFNTRFFFLVVLHFGGMGWWLDYPHEIGLWRPLGGSGNSQSELPAPGSLGKMDGLRAVERASRPAVLGANRPAATRCAAVGRVMTRGERLGDPRCLAPVSGLLGAVSGRDLGVLVCREMGVFRGFRWSYSTS